MSQHQRHSPVPAQTRSLLVLLVLGIAFGGTMLVTQIHWQWIAAGMTTAIVVGLALDTAVLPPSIRRPARAVVLFVVGALVLWVVFERQPAIGVYSSASFGVVLGLAAIRIVQRRRDGQFSG